MASEREREEEQVWAMVNRRHAGRCAGHPHIGDWPRSPL